MLPTTTSSLVRLRLPGIGLTILYVQGRRVKGCFYWVLRVRGRSRARVYSCEYTAGGLGRKTTNAPHVFSPSFFFMTHVIYFPPSPSRLFFPRIHFDKCNISPQRYTHVHYQQAFLQPSTHTTMEKTT